MLTDLNTFLLSGLESDFFAGGIALGVMGVSAGMGRMLWFRLRGFVLRRINVTVTVDNRLPEFRYLLHWLESHGAMRRVRRFRLTWTGGRLDRKASYTPSTGRHWFRVDGHWVRIDRSLSEKAKSGNHGRTDPLETLVLTLPFGRREVVEGWIAAGAEMISRTTRIGPELHIHTDGYWSELGQVVRRPASTLVAEDDRVDKLVADVRWFYGAREWYVARGVPWRRGYLLHGPPGTGKSSAIRAVASELELGLSILDLGRRSLTDDGLSEAVATAPGRSILVIEDIDAAFTERSAGETPTGVSFSGLLNAIDGLAAQEGRALFMTTNHIERLDPALIRPGRADVHVELGLVGAGPAKALFLRFFPGEEALANAFAARIGSERLSPAALQGWLLANAEDAHLAAEAGGLVTPARLAAE